ncbi:MAG: DUF4367 domain-containing protein [Ruminococcus flavefaciens]|nr:DUF4367 domain-containing protein [Ruminococcus flavefaciens]MCM1231056.1 DUF4367 domain-containing protein [Ruminococcus flavefaciens]
MNKKALKRQMIGMKREILADLQNELDEEMSKPKKKRDCDRIAELSNAWFEISCGNNEDVTARRESAKKALVNRISADKRTRNIRLYKCISSAVACAVVVTVIGLGGYKTIGQNIFPEKYSLSKNGVTIDMKDSSEVTAENGDLYGMKSKCAEYGFFPETPSYIPEDFALDDIYEERGSVFSNVKFFYRDGNAKLNFDYHYYGNKDDIPPVGIPTDTYNITEEQINGHTVYILIEDSQYTATYLSNNTVYCITAHNLDYDDYRAVLENMS